MGRRKRGSKLMARFSLVDLQRLLDEKAAAVVRMQERRVELASELSEIEAALTAATGGSMPAVKRGPGRPRKNPLPVAFPAAVKMERKGRKGRKGKRGPRGEGGLQNVIRTVLGASKEPMKLAEVTANVLKAGYQTGSARFGVIVGQRLSEMSDVKKAGRGLYVLK